ncbi:hypothetical protein ACFFOS_27530 [Nocardioides kongjuensis]|uniref:Uncharacterized protein n=1 Tax=Nocardioides kongjuensis TaxID=349522 RepID=A0A852RSL8_9ACTN|nr:hypothetical protein [Nocardioides kongjuensis]NYD33875.1 hypothetical protein [Nocardioides kongjuensis]
MIVLALALCVLVLTVLLAIAVAGNADLAAENRRLRGDHLTLIHPARRTTR